MRWCPLPRYIFHCKSHMQTLSTWVCVPPLSLQTQISTKPMPQSRFWWQSNFVFKQVRDKYIEEVQLLVFCFLFYFWAWRFRVRVFRWGKESFNITNSNFTLLGHKEYRQHHSHTRTGSRLTSTWSRWFYIWLPLLSTLNMHCHQLG